MAESVPNQFTRLLGKPRVRLRTRAYSLDPAPLLRPGATRLVAYTLLYLALFQVGCLMGYAFCIAEAWLWRHL